MRQAASKALCLQVGSKNVGGLRFEQLGHIIGLGGRDRWHSPQATGLLCIVLPLVVYPVGQGTLQQFQQAGPSAGAGCASGFH